MSEEIYIFLLKSLTFNKQELEFYFQLENCTILCYEFDMALTESFESEKISRNFIWVHFYLRIKLNNVYFITSELLYYTML